MLTDCLPLFALLVTVVSWVKCSDHIAPMGEAHLLRTARAYAEYYNNDRPHQSLDGNSPRPRAIEGAGEVVASPVLGGLHHRYSRVA